MSLLKDILHAATGIAGHAAQNAAHAGKEVVNVATGHPANYGMEPQDQAAAHGEAMGAAARMLESGIPGFSQAHKAMDAVQHMQPLPQVPTLRDRLSESIALPQNSFGTSPQLQGADNPGFIPMQNSGQGGAGYGANLQGGGDVYWQNTDGVRRNMVNPQMDDNGFYYN